MSSAMISDITHIKRDMGDLLSDISLHQLSVALSVKNRKRVESRCVALLAYYSFSLNSPSLQSSVVKLGPQFSSKGRIREATRAIHFLLALCGRKHFNGCTKQKQGMMIMIAVIMISSLSNYCHDNWLSVQIFPITTACCISDLTQDMQLLF